MAEDKEVSSEESGPVLVVNINQAAIMEKILDRNARRCPHCNGKLPDDPPTGGGLIPGPRRPGDPFGPAY